MSNYPYGGVPLRERYGGEYPELYCQGCLLNFGQLVPVVFARREDSELYSAVCPVAGNERLNTGGLSHGGPHGVATGADGRSYRLEPDGIHPSVVTRVNGQKVSRLKRWVGRQWTQWDIECADRPHWGNATAAPETEMVVEEFDWSAFQARGPEVQE